MNITISLVLLIVLPTAMYMLGKRSSSAPISLKEAPLSTDEDDDIHGAEKLDRSKILAFIFGSIILLTAFHKAFIKPDQFSLNFITPNFINFVLLGFGILLHSTLRNYLKAIDQAIGGAAGILIQFPLYFGIMGIMTGSGLVNIFSNFFVSISNETTFPIFTFFSAGIVNVFVPSGGGQWSVQGPIIIQAAEQLGVPIAKSVMAMAYGDQLTNMLQPFWALPLLGITGLKAKEILPYTLFLMLIGGAIFILGLLLF
jgi:short-chain fatty acids transporter